MPQYRYTYDYAKKIIGLFHNGGLITYSMILLNNKNASNVNFSLDLVYSYPLWFMLKWLQYD